MLKKELLKICLFLIIFILVMHFTESISLFYSHVYLTICIIAIIYLYVNNINNEETAHKRRATYVSILKHDLKIPTLAQIRALELLLDETLGNLNDSQKEIVNLTLGSCRHMHEMLTTILSTYKYENNDIILNCEKVAVTPLMEICLNKFSSIIEHKNITFRIKCEQKLAKLYADKVQIRQAFEGLIDYCVSSVRENSEIICEIKKIDYGKNLNICFRFEPSEIEVYDNINNTSPVPSERMDKVGSSLSLYLAKQIIMAHKGLFYVENYNTLNVVLPLVNESVVVSSY